MRVLASLVVPIFVVALLVRQGERPAPSKTMERGDSKAALPQPTPTVFKRTRLIWLPFVRCADV